MKTLLLSTLFCLAPTLQSEDVQEPQPSETPEEPQAQPGEMEEKPEAASKKRKRRGRKALSDAVLEEYFAAGDYDSSGMISFREAREALAITRTGFARYDTDRNGLIDSEEFIERYSDALIAGESLPQPLKERGAKRPPARDAAQVRLAFDADADGRLDVVEVQNTLAVYEQEELDSEDTVRRLDVDASGYLELSELEGLVPLLFTGDSLGIVEHLDEEEPEEPGKVYTLFEVFGKRKERASSTSATALPPQIVGPLDHFSRLDYDGDGVLSHADLDALIRPIQSRIRLRAVIATLDLDEDGVVSRAEFWDSM